IGQPTDHKCSFGQLQQWEGELRDSVALCKWQEVPGYYVRLKRVCIWWHLRGPDCGELHDQHELQYDRSRYYTFSNYTDAVQPVTIYGAIPGGNSFILNPPKKSTEFDWLADIAGGTQLIFIMTDSKGRQGGSGPIASATITDDSSCLDANSPASVSNFPSETVSATSGASTSSSSGAASSAVPESSSNTGAIVGGVIGGLFAAFSIGVLAVFFWRRRKTGRRGGRGGRGGNGGFALPFGGSRERRLESVDLDAPTASTDGHPTAHVIQPYPYMQADTLAATAADGAVSYAMTPSAQNLLMQGRGQDARYDASRFSALHDPDPFSPTAQSTLRQSQHTHQLSSESGGMSTVVGSAGDRRSSVSSTARRKAAMAGMPSYKPTRYILHTDLEETQEEPGDVIELPPQYSERRTPITGLGPDYAVPPPGAPPPNHLENHDEPDTRLQQPIEPGPPTPTSPHGRSSPS
ncbi:hypothetical protein EIP86_007584, partial [Pleurotus ostreatoroseus]